MTTQNDNITRMIQNDENTLREGDPDLMKESQSQPVNIQTSTASLDYLSRHIHPYSTHYDPSSFLFVPLSLNDKDGRTHVVSEAIKEIFRQELCFEDIENMTKLFYNKAFLDKTLDVFLRSHDDPHASRFAKWVVTKLTGSSLWNDDCQMRSKEPVILAQSIRHVVHDRSSAHVAAWHSPKRATYDIGRHFQLDECRVWMRLHFWAMRESRILTKSPSFADYYVRFIAHFVRVYESTAPPFARESLRWSEDPSNIEEYIANGREMKGVLGLSLKEAKDQLPRSELQDVEWPYHRLSRE
jgi:hypothetical protein